MDHSSTLGFPRQGFEVVLAFTAGPVRASLSFNLQGPALSKAMPRFIDGCGLLPGELVLAFVCTGEKESQVPNPRQAARRERISAVSVLRQDQEAREQGSSLAADPGSIRGHGGAEKFHHLSASQANLASLTLGRRSRVPPAILPGAKQRSCLLGPGYSARGKFRATTPLPVLTVGHPGNLQGDEVGRADRQPAALGLLARGSSIRSSCPPLLGRRNGLIPIAAPKQKSPLLPSLSVGWGQYPRLGG